MDDEWDRCLVGAEEYEEKMSKRKRYGSRRRRHTCMTKDDVKPRDRKRVERKMQHKSKERCAQLLAKKRNRAAKRGMQCDIGYQYGIGYPPHNECGYMDGHHEHENILPASQLGIEEGSMYERLLDILEGDEINPEDYDLLLLLDEGNAIPTMNEADLSGMQTRVVSSGGVDQPAMSRNELSGEGCCLVCLTPFAEMESGQQLRRLPCNHLYCKECIDHWLSTRSDKCPNLGCYWSSEE